MMISPMPCLMLKTKYTYLILELINIQLYKISFCFHYTSNSFKKSFIYGHSFGLIILSIWHSINTGQNVHGKVFNMAFDLKSWEILYLMLFSIGSFFFNKTVYLWVKSIKSGNITSSLSSNTRRFNILWRSSSLISPFFSFNNYCHQTSCFYEY